ncbi:MAG: hypothetical protein KDJ65_22280 [Anaerolineae bacterium]|nr:hypothetical protein [Anaerolineae bacterium]
MRKINTVLRIGLFALILTLGTVAALVVDETRSLAMADMSEASIEAVAESSSGDVLYAALNGDQRGIYRSDDKGYSWRLVSNGPTEDITALVVHPIRSDMIYAATTSQNGETNHGLLVSDNGGRTWNYTNYALPIDENGQAPEVSVLTVSPDQPGVVYIGTSGQGLYRFYSQNGQFEKVGGDTAANLYVKEVVTVPGGPVYAVATDGLLQVDGSRVERIDTLSVNAISMAVDPVNPKILYAGTVGYGVYRSDDGGQSWVESNEGLGRESGVLLWVPSITIDPENPEHIAITTGIGVGSEVVSGSLFESFDGGQRWTEVAQQEALVEQVTINNGGIYATAENGLNRYGEPLPAPETTVWSQIASLAHPTGVQVLIMLLTILFAGWVLLARLTWIPVWPRNNAS